MIPEKPNIEEYISKFHPDQKKRVRNTYNNFLENLDHEKIEPSVRQDISLEREHVDLVRAISSGFHQRPKAPGSESGFKFSCTDPLSQVDRISTEADVLLARTREFSRVQLCIVACEIDDSQVPRWISNINNIYEVFSKQENKNIILDQLGHSSKNLDEIQYVCLVKSEDFEDLSFKQIESRCDADEFALWSVDMNGHSEICHEGGSLIHKDLREVLDNCFDYDITENPIEYTLASDPIIPLENILYRLVRGKDKYEDTDYPLEFTRSEFVEYYKKGLKLSIPDDQAEDIIDQNVSDMFSLGKKIGILSRSQTKSETKDYRIMYQGSNDAKSAEEALMSKYIDLASQHKIAVQAFESTKEKLDSDQSDLGDF